MIDIAGIKLFCGECANVMRNELADESIDLVVTSPPYDCYSDDTEILTKTGWKLIRDISLGEKVMTLNPHTKEIYFQPTINVYNYMFKGELLHFNNEDIDLLVTKNHNMFITDKYANPCLDRKSYLKRDFNKYSFLRKAEDINTTGYIPYKGYKWNGENKDIFVLPKVECIYNKQFKVFEKKKISMLYWVRFLGIYLSEGSCRNTKNKSKKIKSYEISIKQKNIETIYLIRNILKNLPFDFKENINMGITIFSITDRQLWNYLYQLGNSFEKYIPGDIKNLNVRYLKELIFYMMLGDGTKRKNFKYSIDGFLNYKSVSRKLKNDLQECLLKIGKLSCESKNNYISNKQYSFIKYYSINKNYEKYVGNVVCVKVPEHNIICVRRNGKVMFSGNSLRDYRGYTFELGPIAFELTRVLKPGGVLVWVIGDEVINKSESGTSFRHALFFKDACGLNLHDTMIYEKNGAAFPATRTSNRYTQIFEYVFIFSKGPPKTAHLICDKKNTWAGHRTWGQRSWRNKDGTMIPTSNKPIAEYSVRNNIWKYNNGFLQGSRDKKTFSHPATFPDKLAEDHIITWSNEGDVVLDPLMGSGTTGVMAKLNGRDFIGIEISDEYFELAKRRLKIKEHENIKLREEILGI